MIMEDKAYLLLADAAVVGECLICLLTPSQVYANIKNYGKAHRFIWEAFNGPIPEGMFVCHHCDTPRCIRRSHLFLGTSQDNMNDKVKKNRQHFGGPGRLLNLDVYPSIVSMRYKGLSFQEIGKVYSVSRRTVKRFLEVCSHD